MRIKWLEITVNIIFWILTSWLIISVNSIQVQEFEIVNGEETIQIIRNKGLIYYFLVGQFIFLFVFYIVLHLIQELSKLKDFKIFIIKSLTAIVGLMFVYYLIVRFSNIIEYHYFFNISFAILSFYVISALGYGFIKMWNKNEQDKIELELIKNKAELNLLRSQLQPHFLFNTMNNLLAMVNQKENPKLAKSIDKLSGLLRYVVYETNDEKVQLDREINFLQNFAELNLLRFEEDEIDFEMNVIGDFTTQLIEPGILLCYIENAFKHGVQPEMKSFVSVDIDVSNEEIINFKIENSIPKNIRKDYQGGYGIEANTERLKLVYPNLHSLEIKESNTFNVQLIIKTNESNYS